jgi:hypothetical protein
MAKDDEDDQAKLHLDREWFARAIELSVSAGEGNHRGSHRHGIEPGFTSKFWAKSAGKDSLSESEDDI